MRVKFPSVLGECDVCLEETFAHESYTLVVSHKDTSWLFVLVKLKADKTLETATLVFSNRMWAVEILAAVPAKY